jgi:hypothetical protein
LRADELEMGLARLREELATRSSSSKAKTKGRNSPPRAKREATPRGKTNSEIAKTR